MPTTDTTDTIIDPNSPKHRGEEPSIVPPNKDDHPVALPPGSVLLEYKIDAVLGCGTFGITYLAHDTHLQTKVAIKEYLPGELAFRRSDQSVTPRTNSDVRGFKEGLERFLQESRTLATFRHPHIVRVTRFFETNGSAYMVMDYEKGLPLKQWLKKHGSLSEERLLTMFLPLMNGLEMIHNTKFLHRDIKPANIFVREADESLVLLDFGSARQTITDAFGSMTTIVTPGYAPFEQYYNDGNQGAWSDIYALGAVLYWVITGNKPLEAPARVKNDTLPSAESLGQNKYSKYFLSAIDWALRVDEKQRPQSIADFKAALVGQIPIPSIDISTSENNIAHRKNKPTLLAGFQLRWLLYTATLSVMLISGLLIWKFPYKGKPPYIAKEQTQPIKATITPASPTATLEPDIKSQQELPTIKTPTTSAEVASNDKLKTKTIKTSSPKKAPSAKEKKSAPLLGYIAFRIVPSGQVFIDGNEIGRAPGIKTKKFPIAPGIHKIQITDCGFPPRSYNLNIEVKAKKTKIVQINCTQ